MNRMKQLLFLLFLTLPVWAQRTTTLDIRTDRTVHSTPVKLLQSDTPIIAINLTTDGSTAYDLTDLTCLLTGSRNDYGFTQAGTISSPTTGVISIPISADDIAIPGNYWCDIVLTNGTTIVETLYLGSLQVKDRPGTTTPDESDQTALYVTDADSVLPDQTGNSGKHLQTDGTSTSWATPGAVWGGITGTLSAQTDLATAQGVQDTAIGLNTTHKSSDGTDHANVALNDTHRSSDGSDHSFIDQSVTSTATPTFDGIQFDLTPAGANAEGKLIWNATDGTLAVGMPGGNVTLQIGQEMIALTTNKTGAGLSNGDVVYVSGAQGNRPTVALADADDSATTGVLGLLTEGIADNASGYGTAFGLVRELNTSSFSVGQVLWLSQTAGALTATRPTQPAIGVSIGTCLTSHATDGVVLVKPHIIGNLAGLSDVLISGQSDGDYIYWDNATSTWKAKALSTADVADSTDKRYVTDAESTVIDNTSGTNTGDQDLSSYDTHLADDTKHRLINDAGTLTTELFSASELITRLATKQATIDPEVYAFLHGDASGTAGTVESTALLRTDSNGRVGFGVAPSDTRFELLAPTSSSEDMVMLGSVDDGNRISIDSLGNVELIQPNQRIDMEGGLFIHRFQHLTGGAAIPTGKNTYIGEDAGNLSAGSTAATTSEGSYNTGVGAGVLNGLTTGLANVGIGPDALTNCTTGSNNMAIGFSSLSLLSTASDNTSIGSSSLRVLTTGGRNTAIGLNSGRLLTSGGNNTTGSNSVFLGYDSRPSADGETNQIVIGYQSRGNGPNTVTIGNSSITDNYFNGNMHVTGRVIKEGTYASIYVANASTAQSIATGATHTKSTAYTTDSLSSNCTADAANDKITIDYAGNYRFEGTYSYISGTVNVVWHSAVFVNGVEQVQILFDRKVATSSDVGNSGHTGFFSASATDDVDVRWAHDNGGAVNLTITQSNINVEYIGE